jgi:hypothetical protein
MCIASASEPDSANERSGSLTLSVWIQRHCLLCVVTLAALLAGEALEGGAAVAVQLQQPVALCRIVEAGAGADPLA